MEGGHPGWHFFVWLDLIQRPWYWAIFLLVPGINLIMLTVMVVELGLALDAGPPKTNGSGAPRHGGACNCVKDKKRVGRHWTKPAIHCP